MKTQRTIMILNNKLLWKMKMPMSHLFPELAIYATSGTTKKIHIDYSSHSTFSDCLFPFHALSFFLAAYHIDWGYTMFLRFSAPDSNVWITVSLSSRSKSVTCFVVGLQPTVGWCIQAILVAFDKGNWCEKWVFARRGLQMKVYKFSIRASSFIPDFYARYKDRFE